MRQVMENEDFEKQALKKSKLLWWISFGILAAGTIIAILVVGLE